MRFVFISVFYLKYRTVLPYKAFPNSLAEEVQVVNSIQGSIFIWRVGRCLRCQQISQNDSIIKLTVKDYQVFTFTQKVLFFNHKLQQSVYFKPNGKLFFPQASQSVNGRVYTGDGSKVYPFSLIGKDSSLFQCQGWDVQRINLSRSNWNIFKKD